MRPVVYKQGQRPINPKGFIATAYRAEAIKEGDLLWHP